jgi:hypothetical protein
MTSTINYWEVYYVVNCQHTKPQPKNKYVIIACFDDNIPMGFLINSKINEFIKKRADLMKCEVEILQQDHSFLSYNSYVDCRDIFAFSQSDLTDLRGEIAVSASINTAPEETPDE